MDEGISKKVSENTTDIAVLHERAKSFDQRLSAVEKNTEILYELVVNVRELTVEVKHLGESIKKQEASGKSQGERLGDIEKKPGKKWDGIVDKVLMMVVGAVIAYMLSKIGL
jgi:hypothetical protein